MFSKHKIALFGQGLLNDSRTFRFEDHLIDRDQKVPFCVDKRYNSFCAINSKNGFFTTG